MYQVILLVSEFFGEKKVTGILAIGLESKYVRGWPRTRDPIIGSDFGAYNPVTIISVIIGDVR